MGEDRKKIERRPGKDQEKIGKNWEKIEKRSEKLGTDWKKSGENRKKIERMPGKGWEKIGRKVGTKPGNGMFAMSIQKGRAEV